MVQQTLIVVREDWVADSLKLSVTDFYLIKNDLGSNDRLKDIEVVVVKVRCDEVLLVVNYYIAIFGRASNQIVLSHDPDRQLLRFTPIDTFTSFIDHEIALTSYEEELVKLAVNLVHIREATFAVRFINVS